MIFFFKVPIDLLANNLHIGLILSTICIFAFIPISSDKKLLVIKDSFGNAFIPFLIPHYKNIYIVDPGACDINIKEFVKDNGIEDVLVMNNIFLITKYDFPNLISKLSIE